MWQTDIWTRRNIAIAGLHVVAGQLKSKCSINIVVMIDIGIVIIHLIRFITYI